MDVELRSIERETFAILRLPEKMRVLASTMRNGGFAETDTILMMQVEPGYDRNDPDEDMASKIELLGLEDHVVGFMTAAEIRKAISVAEEVYHDAHAIAVVTSGVHNAVMAGEMLPDSVIKMLTKPGTINIAVAVNTPLSSAGSVNALVTATEAKSAAMLDRGIRGTGTTSDAVAIISPLGEGTKYAGTSTDVGIALARAVRRATSESIRKWSLVNPPMDFLTILDRRGMSLEDLWASAREVYFQKSASELDEMRGRFLRSLESFKDDVNANSLVQAAALLDDEVRRSNIRGLKKEDPQDAPSRLIANETLGIALAEYVSATERSSEGFLLAKQQLDLRGLGPFLRDIAVALISGTVLRIDPNIIN